MSLSEIEQEEPNKILDRLKIVKKHLIKIEKDVNEISGEVTKETFDGINNGISDLRGFNINCKETLSNNQMIIKASSDLILKLSQKLSITDSII